MATEVTNSKKDATFVIVEADAPEGASALAFINSMTPGMSRFLRENPEVLKACGLKLKEMGERSAPTFSSKFR